MIKVLFICHGNICRSPMAEFILKNMISGEVIHDSEKSDHKKSDRKEYNQKKYNQKNRGSEISDRKNSNKIDQQDIYIESAATSREELGNDIYPPAKAILTANKIPFEKRKARQITIADYDRFDYIIGMDDANIRNIVKICGGDPENKVHKMLEFAESTKDVADPWYTGEFETTYEDIVKGCRGLWKTIREKME